MFGPILPLLAQIPRSLGHCWRRRRAKRQPSVRVPAEIAGINTLVSRRSLRLHAADDIASIIARLDANAERNRNRIVLQWSMLAPGERPPPALLFRPAVLEMIDPEVLGVLLSFAHPNDLDRIFEGLVGLRYDPLAVARAATDLAGRYLDRGLDAVGEPLCRRPLADSPLDETLGFDGKGTDPDGD